MRRKNVQVTLHDFLYAVTQSIEMANERLSENEDIFPIRISKVSASISVNVVALMGEDGGNSLTYNDVIVDFTRNGSGNKVNLKIELEPST